MFKMCVTCFVALAVLVGCAQTHQTTISKSELSTASFTSVAGKTRAIVGDKIVVWETSDTETENLPLSPGLYKITGVDGESVCFQPLLTTEGTSPICIPRHQCESGLNNIGVMVLKAGDPTFEGIIQDLRVEDID